MSAGTMQMPREKRNDIAVKIEASIYRKAKMVAAHRDITIAEYLSEVLRAPVERDHKKMIAAEGAGYEREE